jgi:hypothetical protein
MTNPQTRGITYPLKVVNGNLSVSTDANLKSQEIRSVLETRFYERIMRADFGVADKTLDIIDPAQINSDLQRAISTNVLGLSSLEVKGDWESGGEDGIYRVKVIYSTPEFGSQVLQFALAN